MNVLQGTTRDPQLVRLEADVAARMEGLFHRCPALHGFSVQHAASVTRDRVANQLDEDLYLADVAFREPLGGEYAMALVEEICEALLELLDEQPQAGALLKGRAFARVLH